MEEEKKKLGCEDITDEMLLDYEEGELPSHTQADINEHLESCGKCRIRAADIGTISAALGESRELTHDVPIPSKAEEAIFGTISEVAGMQRRTIAFSKAIRWLIPVAALILVVVFAGFWFKDSQRNAEMSPIAAGNYRHEKKDIQNETPKPVEEEEAEELKEPENLKEELEKQYTEQIANQVEANKKLSEELDAQKARSGELEKKLMASESEYGLLQEALAELNGKLDNALKANENITNRLSELESKVEGKDKIIAQLKAEFIKLEEKLTLAEKQNEFLKKALLVEGDLNKDGLTDVSDAMILLKSLMSGEELEPKPEVDLNGDGRVDVGDALSILNRALME